MRRQDSVPQVITVCMVFRTVRSVPPETLPDRVDLTNTGCQYLSQLLIIVILASLPTKILWLRFPHSRVVWPAQREQI